MTALPGTAHVSGVAALLVLLLAGAAPAAVPDARGPSESPSTLSGHWRGEVVREGKRWRIDADLFERDGAPIALLDFPDFGLYSRPFAVELREGGGVRLRFTDGKETVTLDAVRKGDRLGGAWEGLGVTAAFELARVAEARPPLREETVTFANGDVVLSGVLVKPEGAGPFPAIVWTHGSGNQTRATDFYRDRAYLVARAGVAALIYDKRGCGASTGDRNATLYELAGDAVAAVQTLRGRSDIVPDRVGIGGFSQGGYVSPLAAAQYGHIAFVAVGASPGISPAEQNDFAVERALRRQGYGEEVLEEVREIRSRVEAYRRTGVGREEVEAAIGRARLAPWFRTARLPEPPIALYGRGAIGVLDFDPLPWWARVRVPVLALWGEDDELVPAIRSRDSIGTALGRRKSPLLTARIFPGAGHGLAVARREGASWDWPRLVPEFHETLVDWVVAHAAGRR